MRRSSSSVGLVGLVAAALALFLTEGSALAFCRTSSCPNEVTGKLCTPEAPGDCGVALAWKTSCVGFWIQQNASLRVNLATAETVFQQAFATWMDAPCPAGGTPRVAIHYEGTVVCDKHQYNQQEGNANVILFRDDGWPYKGADSTLALTTVTYDLATGEIYDADMEINSTGTPFTTTDDGVVFDLLSIATHEAGHFLGLAHSTVDGATMFPDYKQGSVTLRDLSADDIAGICDAYPPGTPIPASCDTTPRHGFASECGTGTTTPPDEGCCAVAPGSGRRGGREGVLVLALGALGLVARRRARVLRRVALGGLRPPGPRDRP